ncbi:TetR/AcrR family transcriptional regulator [Patulibacter defluvii]|uniref:TetR/AcrR family transcriptional regulator n=1 Tax=Patulibacter defluvii TaxID=3095358 RepID=UPI002A752050|nr:TetR/AcrR family transcriptional regulator [Patulibacter sp. DM4]
MTRPSTRERLLVTTAELFRRQGYAGTGLKQILAGAEAPFGSLYHHFPGGKEELGGEVIRTAGAMYAQLLPAIFGPAPDLVTGVERFFAQAAVDLEASDYQDACPIATVALEVASTNEPLRQATAEVFSGWIDGGTAWFIHEGVEPATARRLVIAMIGALEGAFVLARALRSGEPLAVAGRTIADATRAALAEGPPPA